MMSVDITAGHLKRWSALPFLLAGAFLPVLDYFVINMILPTIQSDLGASQVQVQLVVSTFTGVYAVFLITGSRLGDLCGRRRIFLCGVAGFTLASLVCAFVRNVDALIVVRAFQGLFGALLAPQVLASIQVLFPIEERGKAIGFLGTTYSLSGIVGMILGGLLIAIHPFGMSWQAVFLSYVPMSLAIWSGGLALIPESRNQHANGLDLGGVLLLLLALGLLVLPLSEGRALGWPLWSMVLLGMSPFLWCAFVWYEARYAKRGGTPLVAFILFRDRAFVLGLFLAFGYYISFAFMFCFSLYLQAVRHVSALDIGLINLPFALAFFLSSLVAPAFLKILKAKVLVLGFSLLFSGLSGLFVAVFTNQGWL